MFRLLSGTTIVLLFSAAAQADIITLTKIADRQTPLDQTHLVESINPHDPVMAAGSVVFNAEGGFPGGFSGWGGIYSGNGIGALTVLHDYDDFIPGLPGQVFQSFGPPSRGVGPAFRGSRAGWVGIYRGNEKVADLNTRIPGRTENFTGFGSNPSSSSGGVAFTGSAGTIASRGLFRWTGDGISTLADTSTPALAVSGSLVSFRDPSSSLDTVAFVANWSNSSDAARGVYLHQNDQLHLLATASSPRPNGAGVIGTIGDWVSNSLGTVSFSTSFGVYKADLAHGLQTVVDNTMDVPGGVGKFSAFSETTSISGDVVAFLGYDALRNPGLYYAYGGTVHEVISVGKSIAGAQVQQLNITTGAIDGTDIAFRAAFTDGNTAIYKATFTLVPEPASMISTGLGLALTLAWYHRRRRTRRARENPEPPHSHPKSIA
ncbi:MAG: PEP-CTERM sorting domain-containing protein [Isosphaeraceae bacterium]|nr:PEP-CTERM sorting domain-containing protein [Isosphaeraceae bacterium]